MAAGAIPPPLFFEQRRQCEHRLREWLSRRTSGKHISVDHVVELLASASLTTRDRSPSKDI
jgi:hypothetical protein